MKMNITRLENGETRNIKVYCANDTEAQMVINSFKDKGKYTNVVFAYAKEGK